jgi:DNA-binding IclR family transcriptional regulator
VPIRRPDGFPFAALSVAAVSARLEAPRRDEIVASLTQEAEQIEIQLGPVLGQPLMGAFLASFEGL